MFVFALKGTASSHLKENLFLKITHTCLIDTPLHVLIDRGEHSHQKISTNLTELFRKW
jgi:hypothetical protein